MQINTTEKQEPVYMSEDDISSENNLDDGTGACPSCEGIHSLNDGIVDIMITPKLVIENVRSKTCSNCNYPVGFDDETISEIKAEISEFKVNRPSISELLNTGRSDAYRWCESSMCACMGAANCAGGLSAHLYSKKEWIIWKNSNPLRINKFIFSVKECKNKMDVIKFLRDEFHIPAKEAANVVNKENSKFGVEYNDGTQEQINDDVKEFLDSAEKRGIVFEKLSYENYYVVQTFGRDLNI